MNLHLSAALEYARRGWCVFPLHGIFAGRCTCGRRDCSSPGKHPLVRHGVKDATSDLAQVERWWTRSRRANIGIATGTPSGFVVIDIDLGHPTNTAFGSPGEQRADQMPSVFDSMASLIERGVPTTLVSLTGGGGLHLLLVTPGDGILHNRASSLPGIAGDLPGIDLRAEGGYIVAPPSVHVSGRRYEWLDVTRSIAPAPKWMREPERRITLPMRNRRARCDGDETPYGLAALRDELERLRAAPVGTRNHQLNRAAFCLGQLVAAGELHEEMVRSALEAAGLNIGLEPDEVRKTIESAFDAGLRQPRVAPHRLRSQSSTGS